MKGNAIAALVGFVAAVLWQGLKGGDPSGYGMVTMFLLVAVGVTALATAVLSILFSRTKAGKGFGWFTLAAVTWIVAVFLAG